MFIVLFKNSKGEKKTIGTAKTKEQANDIIHNFLNEHSYKSYYQKRWQVDDKTIKIDIGSHTEFFYIQEVVKTKETRFEIGDYVRLDYVTEEDIIFRRYIGEIGVFQGYDERGCAIVRFSNFSNYLVDNTSLSLSKKASVESIFYAFCYENENELLERLKKYVNE